MALEFLKDIAGIAEQGGSGIASFASALDTLFGSETATTVNTTQKQSGTTTEQLQIDEAGVQKILRDILESEQGLANIFSAENVSGIYDSTAAKAASGELMARLAGEIAKLTAKKVSTTEATASTEQTNKVDDAGVIGSLFN